MTILPDRCPVPPCEEPDIIVPSRDNDGEACLALAQWATEPIQVYGITFPTKPGPPTTTPFDTEDGCWHCPDCMVSWAEPVGSRPPEVCWSCDEPRGQRWEAGARPLGWPRYRGSEQV